MANPASTAPDMSFIGLFLQSGPVVQAVMLVLFISSFVIWAAYIDARRTIARMDKSGRRFEKMLAGTSSLSAFVENLPPKPSDPKMAMLKAAIEEWRQWPEDARRSPAFRDIIYPRIESAIMDAGRAMLDEPQRKIPIFATVGATAPFVGLFGTVWGVMNSFRAIGDAGTTSLAVVAPGIAEALLATALGLLAAIPAVVFTNQLNQRLLRYEEDLGRFSRKIHLIFAQAQIGR